MTHLANDTSVPEEAIRALDELESVWPGATLPQARAAIASAVLAVVIKDSRREHPQERADRELGDPEDLLAMSAHYGYHKATKDWAMIPSWNSPSCLQHGWRAAADAVLRAAHDKQKDS